MHQLTHADIWVLTGWTSSGKSDGQRKKRACFLCFSTVQRKKIALKTSPARGSQLKSQYLATLPGCSPNEKCCSSSFSSSCCSHSTTSNPRQPELRWMNKAASYGLTVNGPAASQPAAAPAAAAGSRLWIVEVCEILDLARVSREF